MSGSVVADEKAGAFLPHSKMLGFAPFQFVAQNFEIGFLGWLD